MRKCGKIPFSRLEDNIQMFEQNKNMKEEIKAKDEALASLKQLLLRSIGRFAPCYPVTT